MTNTRTETPKIRSINIAEAIAEDRYKALEADQGLDTYSLPTTPIVRQDAPTTDETRKDE